MFHSWKNKKYPYCFYNYKAAILFELQCRFSSSNLWCKTLTSIAQNTAQAVCSLVDQIAPLPMGRWARIARSISQQRKKIALFSVPCFFKSEPHRNHDLLRETTLRVSFLVY